MRNSDINERVPHSVLIIGAGRAGAQLAFNLNSAGVIVTGAVQHRLDSRPQLQDQLSPVHLFESVTADLVEKSDIVILAVRDDQLEKVAEQLADVTEDWASKTVVHLSGIHTSDVLKKVKSAGATGAVMHPCLAIRAEQLIPGFFSGTWFDIEGGEPALKRVKALTTALGAKTFRIEPAQKAAVHLAAVLYSNFPVVLAHTAHQVLEQAGLPDELFWEPFKPLVQSVIHNLDTAAPREALTGPIVRRDFDTIHKHLELLAATSELTRENYIGLSRLAMEMIAASKSDHENLNEVVRESGEST